MKAPVLTILLLVIAAVSFTSCSDKAARDGARELLRQARSSLDAGRYDRAVREIDSLRRTFPDALEERKAAIRLRQEAELELAKLNVPRIDSALAIAESELDAINATVEELRAAGKLDTEVLSGQTRAKLKRDSLKTLLDVECDKIKYINLKMRE